MCEISVIIANYNYGRFLETAIRSVVNQARFDECELIIIDGGSSDNSVDVIKKYEAKISYWVSEKDRGQSDAFNKGFSVAKGKFGCWINADDILLPGALEVVINETAKHPNIEWVTGGVVFFNNDLRIWKMRRGTWITKNMHRWVDATVIGGPSSFFSLKRLREIGGFNVKLHYSMDCDLWKRFFVAGMMMYHLNRYFWGFRMHAASKTSCALTGGCSDAAMSEVKYHSEARRFSEKEVARHVFWLRIFKIINGSLAMSVIDTIIHRGKSVLELYHEGK